MQKPPHKVCSFGDFTLDLTRGCLLRDGAEVKLRPKAFELLRYLVENSGRLVSKEDLVRAVWPDTFVTDDAIVKRLKDLRLALQDDSQQYIKTVPRRGYLFAAEVREGASSAPGTLYAQQIEGIKVPIQDEREGKSGDTIEAGSGLPLAAARVRSRRSSVTAVAISGVLFAFALATSYLWISSKSRETGTSAAVQSIAVLPFKPLDASSQDESFETGMTDTLITRLSGLRQILVRPISAVRNYTRLEQDPVAAGRELKVDTVLDGSVQRAANRVRVTVRLIRVADGLSIWGGRFEEEFKDIFAAQDAIAEKVVGALAIELTREERRLFAKRHTENTEAYHAYTKGRYYWNKHTEDGARKSIEYYQHAIEKDPNYALPYVGLADTHTLLGLYYLPPKEAMPKAKAYAENALKLDGTLAAAHAALGAIAFYHDWDWRAAQREVSRAQELDPRYVAVYSCYLHYQGALNQPGEAVAEIRGALDRDPLSLFINAEMGCAFYYARQYDKAIDQMRHTLEMDPNYAKARHSLARAYGQKGMYREAIAELIRARALSRGAAHMVAELAYVYAVSGNTDEARKLLGELKGRATRSYVSPYLTAFIYLALGDKDHAFESLEDAYQDRSIWMPWLKVDPKFDGLRSDPRFTELLRRVGLPQ